MPQNFISCDRDQAMLMPPSLLDWVPEDHVVWTILGAVDELDLSAFYGAYRADGHGRPAFAPPMMVALLLYAYSKGNRSSRGIERACREDVAYMVISAQQAPDHSTIAEFRKRHEQALAELFTGVLGLCKQAGLVEVGVIAIDGTKVAANASLDANRSYEAIAREVLKEAAETDRREDELYGSTRGDELPEQLRTREGRHASRGSTTRRGLTQCDSFRDHWLSCLYARSGSADAGVLRSVRCHTQHVREHQPKRQHDCGADRAALLDCYGPDPCFRRRHGG
jgi:transposase